MKRITNLIIPSLLFISIALFAQPNTSVRLKEDFNKNWKFKLSDNPEFRSPSYNDAKWRKLNVPHDWSIEADFCPSCEGMQAFLPEGIGWYRKTFKIDESFKKRKQTTIQFDGVYMNSEVWVNGVFLGRYPFGYNSFQYDITEYLNYGNEPNIIAVRVDNSLNNSTRWYNGSGIYRNVHLIHTNYAHFKTYGGIFVTTPVAEKDWAIVNVEYKVNGNLFSEEELEKHFNNKWKQEKQKHDCIVRSIVYNDKGEEVARKEEKKKWRNFNMYIEYAQKMKVLKPKRWSAEKPNMYYLKSEIEYMGKVLDDEVTPFGIRKLEYIPHKGMFVNGESTKLHGVCLHHDGGCVGAAVPDKVLYLRLKRLKELGCNAIRTAHNPFSPEFYHMCDTIGLYVMDEAFDEWTHGWPYNFSDNNRGKAQNGYQLYFNQWAETDLRAMIRRDRNHPSIVMYSIANEVPDQKLEDGYMNARKLVKICHEEDPTRPVTGGCDQYLYAMKNGFMDELDISGFNYVARHLHDSCYLVEYMRRPNKLSVGTEVSNEPIYYFAYKNNDFAIGHFIWTGVSYLGESRAAPKRGSSSGLLDFTLNPRTSGLMYEAFWSKKPTVNICTKSTQAKAHLKSSWNYKNGDSIEVTIYSNCDEVELFLNGKSVGRKVNDANKLTTTWDVIYKEGKLSAVGYNASNKVKESSLVTTGKPAKIIAKPLWTTLKADGADISIIELSIVDANGNLVPEANNIVSASVKGAGTFVGFDSGNMEYEGSYQASKRDAYRGRLNVLVKSNENAGEITIKLSAKGLSGTEVKLKTGHR